MEISDKKGLTAREVFHHRATPLQVGLHFFAFG
jgi:hypothetical protein